MQTRFPWAALMAAGIGRLRLSPREFWAMTPRELLAALGPARPETMTRADLARLMASLDERCDDD